MHRAFRGGVGGRDWFGKARVTLDASETSTGIALTDPVARGRAAATDESSPSASMSIATTSAPAAAYTRTDAAPIPRAAPVTITEGRTAG